MLHRIFNKRHANQLVRALELVMMIMMVMVVIILDGKSRDNIFRTGSFALHQFQRIL